MQNLTELQWFQKLSPNERKIARQRFFELNKQSAYYDSLIGSLESLDDPNTIRSFPEADLSKDLAFPSIKNFQVWVYDEVDAPSDEDISSDDVVRAMQNWMDADQEATDSAPDTETPWNEGASWNEGADKFTQLVEDFMKVVIKQNIPDPLIKVGKTYIQLPNGSIFSRHDFRGLEVATHNDTDFYIRLAREQSTLYVKCDNNQIRTAIVAALGEELV